jgi:hypothetical protein
MRKQVTARFLLSLTFGLLDRVGLVLVSKVDAQGATPVERSFALQGKTKVKKGELARMSPCSRSDYQTLDFLPAPPPV